MRITEDDLIKALEERDIPVNKRVLTDWRRRYYLPSLRSQGRGQGKGRDYFWTDPDLMERAVLVDELLCDGFKGTELNLVLWLFGYESPLPIVRNRLLAGIEKVERAMTGGNRSAGEIEDYISQYVYDYGRIVERINKKYPELELPQPREPSEIERVMNLLANPGMNLDDLQSIEDYPIAETPAHAAKWQNNDLTPATATPSEGARSGWEWVRLHFALTELKASLASASDQELCQAGEDVRRLITTAGRFFNKLPEVNSLRPQKNHAVYRLGSALILLDLSLRRGGFGPYIDAYLAQFCEKWEEIEPSSGEYLDAP